ncbi:MAG: FAD-dependent oxidoreductase [Pseudomonadota bacterium]
MSDRRVIIVGAGIIGASIAWHLAEAGYPVLVLESSDPGLGVTSGAIGWLNSANGPDPAARKRRAEALTHWKREPFCDFVAWCGALRDQPVPGSKRCEPPSGLDLAGPVWTSPQDGMIDPVVVTRSLLERPEIEIRQTLVTTVGAHWAQTERRLTAHAVVVAAGLGSLDLLPELPIRSGPVLSLSFGKQSACLTQIVHGWGVELYQRSTAELVGVAELGSDPLRIRRAAEKVLGTSLPTPRVQRWDRPMTEDAMPVLCCRPEGVFVAVGHPGLILAPMIGQKMARLIARRSIPATKAL